MTDKKQPDALELASVAESADLAGYPTAEKANAYCLCLLEDCANMIRRLHAENEALRAERESPALPEPDTHCFDDDTQKDVWSYSEGLVRSILASDRAMRAAKPAGAQAAPATAAGSGEVVAHRVMRKSISGEWASDARDWSDGPPSRALVDSIRADKGRWRIDVAYAAPTTQPVPQQEAQEPVAWLDPWTGAKVTTDYDAYGKHGIPLYTAPQPQPTSRGDALDAARYRYLRDVPMGLWPAELLSAIRLQQNAKWDAAIDAARAAQGASDTQKDHLHSTGHDRN